jgi:hypothetical protein
MPRKGKDIVWVPTSELRFETTFHSDSCESVPDRVGNLLRPSFMNGSSLG